MRPNNRSGITLEEWINSITERERKVAEAAAVMSKEKFDRGGKDPEAFYAAVGVNLSEELEEIEEPCGDI